MGTCRNHENRETKLWCAKNYYYLCDECADCYSPEMHCQHRPSCPIWFLRSERKRAQRQAAEKAAQPAGKPGKR